jgi:hypothetical protein
MATNDAAALSLTLFSVSCPGPAPASRLRQMLIAHLRPVLQPCLRSTRPASQRRRPRPSPTTPLRSRRSTRTGAQTPLSASTRPRPGARAPTRTRARSGPSASSSNSSQPGRRRVACVASLPAAQPPSSTEHSTPPFVTCFFPFTPFCPARHARHSFASPAPCLTPFDSLGLWILSRRRRWRCSPSPSLVYRQLRCLHRLVLLCPPYPAKPAPATACTC